MGKSVRLLRYWTLHANVVLHFIKKLMKVLKGDKKTNLFFIVW